MTISVTKDSGEGPSSPSGETFGLASADDTGPVNIITVDPTCAAWRAINATLSDVTNKEWVRRDPAIPAGEWSPTQRAAYEEVGQAMLQASDQTVQLAKGTPHRVMRELYEQFIAYARAYGDSIPNYLPDDDYASGVVIAVAGTLTNACTAIEYGSAQARAPLVPVPDPPSDFSAPSDPNAPQEFLKAPDPTCPEWGRLFDKFDADTKAWQNIDANVSATSWSPAQRAIIDAVIPVMTQFADDIAATGRRSDNPVIQDFAVFAAQYRRAYADALRTYTPKDSFLATTSLRSASIMYQACQAVGT